MYLHNEGSKERERQLNRIIDGFDHFHVERIDVKDGHRIESAIAEEKFQTLGNAVDRCSFESCRFDEEVSYQVWSEDRKCACRALVVVLTYNYGE